MPDYRKLIFYLWLGLLPFVGYSQKDSSYSEEEFALGLTEISAGADVRFNSFKNEKVNLSAYTGFLTRVQTSFLGLLVDKKWFKKICIADYENGELSGGWNQSNNPLIKTGAFGMYNFELGALILYRISKNTDAWFNITFLQFSRDYFSDFWGGSNYRFRLRHKKWMYELSWISENKFYFGAFNFLVVDQNLPKILLGCRRYLKPGHFIAAQCMSLPAFTTYETGQGSERVITLQCTYGLNF